MHTLAPLNHTGSVTLHTPRLTLRKTRLSDAHHMYHNWTSDPEVAQYLTWEVHESLEVTQALLASWEEKNNDPTYYHWAITLNGSEEIIGTLGAVSLNERHQSAELGYCLTRKHWGQGYITEAVGAIVDHLLNTVGLQRIVARHNPNNPASGRVMEKCGMAYEGTQRKVHFCPKHGLVDLACYAIVKQ